MKAEAVRLWLDHGGSFEHQQPSLVVPEGLLFARSAKDPLSVVAVLCGGFDGASLEAELLEVTFLALACGDVTPERLLVLDARLPARLPARVPTEHVGWLVRALGDPAADARLEVRLGRLVDRLVLGPTVVPLPAPSPSVWTDQRARADARARAAESAPAASLRGMAPRSPAGQRRGWSLVRTWPEGEVSLRTCGQGANELNELRAFERLADALPVNLRRAIPSSDGLLLDLAFARSELARHPVEGDLPQSVWALSLGRRPPQLLVRERGSAELFAASTLLTNEDDPGDARGLRHRILKKLEDGALVCRWLRSSPELLDAFPNDDAPVPLVPVPLVLVEEPAGPDRELTATRLAELRCAQRLGALLGVQVRSPTLRVFRQPDTSLKDLFRQLEERGVCSAVLPPWQRAPGGSTIRVCFANITDPLTLLPFTGTDLMQACWAILWGPPSGPQEEVDTWREHTAWLAARWVDPVQRRHMLGLMQECGDEAIAYYNLFHNEVPEWGIYFHMDAMGFFAGAMHGRANPVAPTPPPAYAGLSFLDVFAGLMIKVLFHEWHHHVEEVGVSGLEVLRGEKLLIPWYRACYPPGQNALNERLANADAIASLSGFLGLGPRGRGLTRTSSRTRRDLRAKVLAMAKDAATRSPGTYGLWAEAERDGPDPQGSSRYDRRVSEWLSEVVGAPVTGPPLGLADDRVAAFHGYRLALASSYSQSVPVRLYTDPKDQRRMERTIQELSDCYSRADWR